MQYQFNERYEQVKTITFKNSLPLHVERIRYFKEQGVTGTFTKKEFRYSFDNVTWTNWNTLTQGNLSGIQFRDEPDFYLEVVYHRVGIATGNIERWYLYYDERSPTPPAPPVDASIDAWTLQGEGPLYYLDRENHFGPYTDLVVLNVPDGSTIGVYSHRVDTSAGTEIYFKRIEGSGSVTVTEAGGIITINSDASGGGSATYQNPDPTIEGVGGIPDGSTYFATEKTFAQVMEDMFYPLSYPSFTNPYTDFTWNLTNSLYEINTAISINFSSGLNRGSINPQYDASSAYRSGLGNTVYYTGTGLPPSIGSYPVSPDTQSLPSYVVAQGYNTWTSAWAYDEGVMPYDSKGNEYDPPGPLPAGTTSYIQRRFEGVYPIWATWQNIGNPTELDTLYSMISGNNIEIDLVVQPPFQPEYQEFDIPTTWLTSRPLAGVETWAGEAFGWIYEGGSASESISSKYWVQSSVTHVHGGVVPYTRFQYSGTLATDRGATLIRLKF